MSVETVAAAMAILPLPLIAGGPVKGCIRI
jgi:hypothetical protein